MCFGVEGKGALVQTTGLNWCDKSCLNYTREHSHSSSADCWRDSSPEQGGRVRGSWRAAISQTRTAVCRVSICPSPNLHTGLVPFNQLIHALPLTKEFEVDLIYKSKSINFYPLLCQYSICHTSGDLSTVNNFHFPISAEYSREQVSVQNPKGLHLPFLFRVVYCL